MLESHPLQQGTASPQRMASLLGLARDTIAQGMASMDEYGDMLKWALPGKDGMCRYVHVFHPGFCSYRDTFYGTIHYHGGEIRGTVLLGRMEHAIYDATPDPDGDRFFGGCAYRLIKHVHAQPAGTQYSLAARVPHWTVPTELTVTYFEEEDNGAMGDLVNPATSETDAFRWEQEDADALLPGLLQRLDAALVPA